MPGNPDAERKVNERLLMFFATLCNRLMNRIPDGVVAVFPPRCARSGPVGNHGDGSRNPDIHRPYCNIILFFLQWT